ncbi:MAG: hypothetical protein Q7S21_04220 [archaeon]|nr:hypothetical protein [archaeon]
MVQGVISSFDKFSQLFPIIVQEKSERLDALKKYFGKGGVISVGNPNPQWPKLIYPSALKIQEELKELEKHKTLFSGKHKTWKDTHTKAKQYDMMNEIKKFGNKLFWEHNIKKLRDPDYKKDADKVKLPVKLVSDPKWTPMIRMFVTDIEYRKNLTETFENSIVYGEDKELGKYAYQLRDFRKSTSEKEMIGLGKKLSRIEEQIKVLQTMNKWAQE